MDTCVHACARVCGEQTNILGLEYYTLVITRSGGKIMENHISGWNICVWMCRTRKTVQTDEVTQA